MALNNTASLRDALQWIADNDAPGDNETPEKLASYMTVVLVADIFGSEPIEIAKAVYAIRGFSFEPA